MSCLWCEIKELGLKEGYLPGTKLKFHGYSVHKDSRADAEEHGIWVLRCSGPLTIVFFNHGVASKTPH